MYICHTDYDDSTPGSTELNRLVNWLSFLGGCRDDDRICPICLGDGFCELCKFAYLIRNRCKAKLLGKLYLVWSRIVGNHLTTVGPE